MVTAIRQQVTIKSGGVVEVQSTELPIGAHAEVIVLLDPGALPSGAMTGQDRLKAFDSLQQRLNLTGEAAANWIQSVIDERREWSRKREPLHR